MVFVMNFHSIETYMYEKATCSSRLRRYNVGLLKKIDVIMSKRVC